MSLRCVHPFHCLARFAGFFGSIDPSIITSQLLPWLLHRFKPSRAKEIMHDVLKTKLTGTAYHADNTSAWAREIADDIKAKLKGMRGRVPFADSRITCSSRESLTSFPGFSCR